jgi:hypothetical protein
MGKTAESKQPPSGAPIDWAELKARILERLNVAAEFESLGLVFTMPKPNGHGWRECHAAGRRDDVPSAAVNLETGIYHDSGGSGESLNFFDFAMRYGDGFARYVDVLKHYAERVGLEMPRFRLPGGRLAEAAYHYRDPAGVERYKVIRYRHASGKKTFSQESIGSDGKPRYGTGAMDGITPLPYRLPELLAPGSDDKLVWIFEGEKDCDRAAAAGLVCTTNHGGAYAADKTWAHFRPEWFRGRQCLVVPDNDESGHAHAHRVARWLLTFLGAEMVRIVELPGLPAHGDFSTWLDLGHVVEELRPLALAAADFDPEAQDARAGGEAVLVASLGPPAASYNPPSAVAGAPAGDGTPPAPVVRPTNGRHDPGGQVGNGHESNGHAPAPEVLCTRLADVSPQIVEWLIPGKVPRGKLTLIVGAPGLGKSFLCLDLVARVSCSGLVPAGAGETIAGGQVVVVSAEDDLGDTVRPRLDAAGADVTRIHALTTIRHHDGRESPFDLSYLPQLETKIAELGDVRLVVIDPITSYLGADIDDFRNTQVRAVLTPLADMAKRLDLAIVLVHHLNKSNGANAINRISGSLAYVAIARVAWLAIRDPEDFGRRLVLSVKNNLGPETWGLAFRIDEGRVAWENDPVLATANDVLRETSARENPPRGERSSCGASTRAAADWLRELLAGGKCMLSAEIFAEGAKVGISQHCLYRAKDKLDIRPRKDGYSSGRWLWQLPPAPPASDEPY